MKAFESLLELALAEDLGSNGDVTSQAIFSTEQSTGVIVCRSGARLAGIGYAQEVFFRIDPTLLVKAFHTDGADVPAGAPVLAISGTSASILMAERIALNFLGYLSGIATETRAHVAIAAEVGKTVILDTRKTLPGYRELAKEAVRLGGGTNHRMGLHDMVMIKDNHIDAAGGIIPAYERITARHGDRFRIEIECRTVQDVECALNLDIDVIMLDNMNERDCAAALALRKTKFPGSKTKFEASGDMNPEKMRRFVGIGLDYISIGRLTHSVTAANFSLQIRP